MRRGFSTLLIIILVVFLSLPVLFWIYSKNRQEGVTKGAVTAKNGFVVYVSSDYGTWDLEKYICETKQDCLSSLDSGSRLETISGGKTINSSIFIKYSPNYSQYSYMKIYVKPGWNSTIRNFKIINKGDIPNTEIYNLEETNIVLIPLQYVSEVFNYSVHFSD